MIHTGFIWYVEERLMKEQEAEREIEKYKTAPKLKIQTKTILLFGPVSQNKPIPISESIFDTKVNQTARQMNDDRHNLSFRFFILFSATSSKLFPAVRSLGAADGRRAQHVLSWM